jgi:hypothetical protein
MRFNTLRGIFYKLQSTPDLNQAFTDDGGDLAPAVNSSTARTNNFPEPRKFYRVISALVP